MSAANWARIKDVFQAALERAPAERPLFLDEACRDQAELRQEVESLLASHHEAGAFLSVAPALEAVPGELEPEVKRIGPYRILGLLGRGGMGAVYRAVRDDDAFQKTVAVKLVQGGHGSLDNERRFRQERQILAHLQHPAIATLLDGGTTEGGQPYLVMEYVEGRPITRYCDEQGLGTRQRLALFETICGAVHYAHQNLVVHRDLKPDNILVTADGRPKLLDFGIAKLVAAEAAEADSEEAPTATRFPRMTPEYASPEQVKGERVTTASDIYSMGVLLYELLAGRRPYALRADSFPELVRAVCETVPPPPSDAARRLEPSASTAPRPRPTPAELRGDLDTIVMKALRKEPARRYLSAQELSDDLRLYLEGRPVHARPDTLRYRTAKFVVRHRAAVSGVLLLVLSLLGGLAATLRQARIASAERTRAERRFADVRRLANSFLFEFHDAIRDLPGAMKPRELVVRTAVEYLDKLASEAGDDPVLLGELVTAYLRLATVAGQVGESNLGQAGEAADSCRKAVRLAEGFALAAAATPAQRLSLARAYGCVPAVATGPEARASLQRAFAVLAALPDRERAAPEARVLLARLLYEKGREAVRASNLEAAKISYQESVRLYEELWRLDPANREAERSLSVMRKYYGAMLQTTGELGAARVQYRLAVDLDRRRLESEPHSARARLDLSYGCASVANVDAAAGDFEAALRGYREALVLREAVASADPADVHAQVAVARAHEALASVLTRKGDPVAAAGEQKQARAIREALARRDAPRRTAAR